jgi:hypothetical protein
MVESGEGTAATAEDPQARFGRLEAQIAKARRQLASLRHDGERHFIDQEAVHPEVPGLLEEVVRRGGELEHLRAAASGSHAVNPALTPAAGTPAADEEHRRLDDLEARITRLNQLCGDDPHSHERHFIDS